MYLTEAAKRPPPPVCPVFNPVPRERIIDITNAFQEFYYEEILEVTKVWMLLLFFNVPNGGKDLLTLNSCIKLLYENTAEVIFWREMLYHSGLLVRTFEFATQKQERKGGWEPSFASNLRVNFRVLIRPYWPGQVHSNNKDTLFDPLYKNWNVRGRKGLKNWQSLILFTVRKMC